MSKTLLVIIPDRLSDLIKKGEIIDRYYNPGNFFDDVHILMTNNDQPDYEAVKKMVGDASLNIHNLPYPKNFFLYSLGWQLPLIQKWCGGAVELAKEIRPNLIRTHNNFLEGYLAVLIKRNLHIPYVTSLHGIWDVDDLKQPEKKIRRLFRKKIEIETLKNADSVICVYSPILDYAKRHGAEAHILIHNFISERNITPKTSWNMSSPIRLVTINRQLPEKNPINIIKAISLLDFNLNYTLVGNGILHEPLKQMVHKLGLDDKIEFLESLNNEEVCRLYHDCDIMVSNCHYKGISKTIIEAALTGLPIVINRYNDGYKLAEYEGDWLEQCDDTPEGYAGAIEKVLLDSAYRQFLSQKAFQHAWKHFDPDKLEKKVVDIYRSILDRQ
jgi:glycosyltransferase involved in cell wall biosynthesis